jgi:hypothetical protein
MSTAYTPVASFLADCRYLGCAWTASYLCSKSDSKAFAGGALLRITTKAPMRSTSNNIPVKPDNPAAVPVSFFYLTVPSMVRLARLRFARHFGIGCPIWRRSSTASGTAALKRIHRRSRIR